MAPKRTSKCKMHIQFWGVRGTLPVPGKLTERYGGNTSCVTLRCGDQLFIFDAGTGIKALSNCLMKKNQFPLSAKIFITHPHYDHIHGIPFFTPLYMPGNEFEILGTHHKGLEIEKLISGQMDNVYFPITIKEFLAKLKFRNLNEESFDIGELHIQTILLNHPGICLGYRVSHNGKSFCYITDNEIYHENHPDYNQHEIDRLIQFIYEADLVVMDSTYIDGDYLKKIGWGHSCVSRVIDITTLAKVKKVCLFHHDPDQTDKDIDIKTRYAKMLLKEKKSTTICVAPKEGDKIVI